MSKLHANPNDEFTFPDIGPNYGIISRYEEEIRNSYRVKQEPFDDDPIIVEKLHSHGYLIMNGHHRWAAAKKQGLKKIRFKSGHRQKKFLRKPYEKGFFFFCLRRYTKRFILLFIGTTMSFYRRSE